MPGPARPKLFTIDARRPFADALATGLIRRFGTDPARLARGLVLLPNGRAVRAVTDAFVRASGGGLLLPRLVAVGDAELDEDICAAIDPADADDPVPPAIAPLARRMILARLVGTARAGEALDAAEAVRLAGELARTLDQMLIEEIAPARLRELALDDTLSAHWERALAVFETILTAWPAELARMGHVDRAERRRRLIDALCMRWRSAPPAGFVCAAGVTSAAPVFARLLRVVSELPLGMVVFPALATEMEVAEWDALGPHPADAAGYTPRSIENHPQFQLKLLLARMGVARGEVDRWPGDDGSSAARARGLAVAMAPAAFTGKWTELAAPARALPGVRAAEFATPAEEAQGIALALREAVETPGRMAALITPDRALARRVAAHLGRWGIAIDDSAGRPLSILPPGVLLLALAEAGAQGFAPLALLALLKHPLVAGGAGRAEWLEGTRALDLALRGPRPAAGLGGIDARIAEVLARRDGAALASWWQQARALLAPLEVAMRVEDAAPAPLLATLRETADALCGAALWAGPAGRAAADLIAELEAEAPRGPARIAPAALAPMLRVLMDEAPVRLPQGGHPRLAILGLIEARLQRFDLAVLGGLNEGVWPAEPAPDPWLAPRIRAELGLPALERRIGIAAHDFVCALGAREVLLTRARRDATSPTIASRFWLRLQAMTGGLARDGRIERWATLIDDPGEQLPAARPAPAPPAAARPRLLSVTEVDRLKADPFAFYARRMLGLGVLDAVDADPSAAWRGTAVHDVLHQWFVVDGGAPERLLPRAHAMLAQAHPLLRALWQPRLIEAIGWIARTMVEQGVEGRHVLAAELEGRIEIAGVTLKGKFDRIDRLADDTLAIVDYKTGKAPSKAAVREGFSLQLGLLGLIAERGGFAGVRGRPGVFEYWSLARSGDGFGAVSSPCTGREAIPAEGFTALAARQIAELAGEYLTGTAPFVAKLHPEYAPYGDYDQLMRLEEWYGRGG